MTIKTAVRNALTRVSGNQNFTAKDLQVENANIEQIQRAIRDIPYVERSNGTYRVRGRKVSESD
jgi:hypothetical protein